MQKSILQSYDSSFGKNSLQKTPGSISNDDGAFKKNVTWK